MWIIVYFECIYEVVFLVDDFGLMKKIVIEINNVVFGIEWVVGIEVNLVGCII